MAAQSADPVITPVEKATSSFVNSQSDVEEEKALREIASKIQTEEEQSQSVLNMIKAEQAHAKKHDIRGEIKMLRSG
jgi:hypothetical protein